MSLAYNFLRKYPSTHRQQLPQIILSALPFLLVFPIGVIYTGVGLFILAWLFSGSFAEKWNNVRRNPLFFPVLVMLGVVFFDVLFLSADNMRRWPAFGHYLIFLFLFLFLSVGGGVWQRHAKLMFFAGAVLGASLFCLARLDVLSGWTFFHNFTIYGGNKSIALGITLAIAAAWLLNDALAQLIPRKKIVYLFFYAYIAVAVLFFATTRTGILLLVLLSFVVVIHRISFNWRGILLLGVAVATLAAAWQASPVVRERTMSTFDALRTFSDEKVATGQGNRLQFVKFTGEMILEKPVLGHGIGSWLQQYPVRAQGFETAQMTTPHNDYLLYAAEMGLIGLLALLIIYASLLLIARKIGGEHGIGLALVSVALIFGSMFNAFLRDWKFGVPMMILLAISLAGCKSESDSTLK